MVFFHCYFICCCLKLKSDKALSNPIQIPLFVTRCFFVVESYHNNRFGSLIGRTSKKWVAINAFVARNSRKKKLSKIKEAKAFQTIGLRSIWFRMLSRYVGICYCPGTFARCFLYLLKVQFNQLICPRDSRESKRGCFD